eukprot:7358061-Prymnesium_polylepis.1
MALDAVRGRRAQGRDRQEERRNALRARPPYLRVPRLEAERRRSRRALDGAARRHVRGWRRWRLP